MDHKIRFGVVLPWPGIKNAETEFIMRLKVAAEECGYECIAIDNEGHILNDSFEMTDEFIKEPLFVITTHFETGKFVDSFYYHTLWNPPEFPLNRDDYNNLIDNYIMNDDFLVYDAGSMLDHLKSVLFVSGRNLSNASSIMSSFPASAVKLADLSNPKLFYCGMNWDVLVDKHGRNESVMKLLDEAGIISIYGPNSTTNKAWGGIHPWEGYKCYKYPIPFDGFSLVEELNKCGICLVLSSHVHRRAGAVTNRIFEACAAGAVIISDNNEKVKEMFGDSVLYIDYNKRSPKDTFCAIKEKYDWIIANRNEAEKLAIQSQQIFLKKYTLNRYLKGIIQNHNNRIAAVGETLYARTELGKIVAFYICNTTDIKKAQEYIKLINNNIKKQLYKNICLCVTVDEQIESAIKDWLHEYNKEISLESMRMFDKYGSRIKTDGEVFINISKSINCEYFVITNAGEIWYQDHITSLVRIIQDEDCVAAISGQCFFYTDSGKHVKSFFKNIDCQALESFDSLKADKIEMQLPYPGAVVLKKEILSEIPEYMFSNVDGWEHMLMLNVLYYIKNCHIGFSKRMTFKGKYKYLDKRHEVLNEVQEARYINGIVKYEKMARFVPTSSRYSVSEQMSFIPMKAWITMRGLRILLRFTGEKNGIGKWLFKKYNEVQCIYMQQQGL